MLVFHKPVDVDLFSTCMWEIFMLSPVIVSFYSVIFTPHTTRKASVGMYSGYDSYIYNPVCLLFGTAIPTSSFNFIQLFLYLFLLFLLLSV